MKPTRLLHGFHAVGTRLRQNPASFEEVFVDAGRHDARMRELIRQLEEAGIKVVSLESAPLNRLAPEGRHQGVVARVKAAEPAKSLDDILDVLTEPPFLLLLDEVQDPHNLGACLRVADTMGVHAVVAPKDRSVGLNATVSKVACGAAETVPYIMVTNLARTITELQELGVWVVGAAGEADVSLYGFAHTGPLAWVLGAEGTGLRRLTRERCDQLVSIPMFGHVESLNVSVATGICLSESRRQREAAKAGNVAP